MAENSPNDGRPHVPRTDLLTAHLVAATVDRAQLTQVELAPGQQPGAHHHPCDVVGVVLNGTIRFELDDGRQHVLRTGDAFFEPRDTLVAHFDNDSTTSPATFLACYLLGPGDDELITMGPPH